MHSYQLKADVPVFDLHYNNLDSPPEEALKKYTQTRSLLNGSALGLSWFLTTSPPTHTHP